MATGKQFGYLPQGPIFGFEITAPENGLKETEIEKESFEGKQILEMDTQKSDSLVLDRFPLGFPGLSERQIFEDENNSEAKEPSAFVVNLTKDSDARKTAKEEKAEAVAKGSNFGEIYSLEKSTVKEQEEQIKNRTGKRNKNLIMKRTEILENSLDMLTKLFPNKKRSVLELVLKRCDDDLIKAIEEIVPKTIDRSDKADSSNLEIIEIPKEYTEKQSKTFEALVKHKIELNRTSKNMLFVHEDQNSAFKPVISKIANFLETPVPESVNYTKFKKSEFSMKHQIDFNKNCFKLDRNTKNGSFNHTLGPPNPHWRSFGPYTEMEPDLLRTNTFGLPFSSGNLGFGGNPMSTALLALGGPGFNFGCALNNFNNFSNNGIAISNGQSLNGFPSLNHFGMLSSLNGQTDAMCSNAFFLQIPATNLNAMKSKEEFQVQRNPEILCGERHAIADELNVGQRNENEA